MEERSIEAACIAWIPLGQSKKLDKAGVRRAQNTRRSDLMCTRTSSCDEVARTAAERSERTSATAERTGELRWDDVHASGG